MKNTKQWSEWFEHQGEGLPQNISDLAPDEIIQVIVDASQTILNKQVREIDWNQWMMFRVFHVPSKIERAADKLCNAGRHHGWFRDKPWRDLDLIGQEEFLGLVDSILNA